MLRQRSRRKLPYPAGLFSLAILPLLAFCLFYQKELIRSSQHTLEVTLPEKKDTAVTHLIKKYSEATKITLTGTDDDKTKLEYISVAVKELMLGAHGTEAITVTLGEGMHYSSLVKLYDICLIYGVNRYFQNDNSFYILVDKESPEEERSVTLICGTSYRFLTPTVDEWTEMFSSVKSNVMIVSCLSLLYTVMLGMAIINQRKKM